jgi:hypothetical protein
VSKRWPVGEGEIRDKISSAAGSALRDQAILDVVFTSAMKSCDHQVASRFVLWSMLGLLGVRHRATPLSRWFLCIDEVGYSLMSPAMKYQMIAVIVVTTLSFPYSIVILLLLT